MTIIECLAHSQMLGDLPVFRDLTTWKRWLVFLCAVYGLNLSHLREVGIGEAESLDIFQEHTARSTYAPPEGGWSEVAAIVGRQSGKTRIAATIAAFEAVTAQPEPDGTEVYAVLVAQDQRASLRSLFSYAVAPFDQIPALSRMVPTGWRSVWGRARRADSLALETGVRIAVYPCRPASVRGIRSRVVVLDEVAFYRSAEGYPTDLEMLRAARPTLATTAGKLIILSSPYGQSGALWDLHRRHYAHDDSGTLVWQASAPAMNPTLPADYLARMQQDDPEAYRSEVLGEFRAGLSTFLDPDAVAACVAEGVRERAPVAGISYTAFCDPSGGRRDAFTLSIGHRDGDCAVLDVCRAWPAPHNPSGVIQEAAALLRRYGVAVVEGDRFGGEFPPERFRAEGIEYVPARLDRSALYLGLLPLISAARVLLLDDAELLRELRGLERRRGSSGRDRVDHRAGGHDDRSNSAAGVLTRLERQAAYVPLHWISASTPDSELTPGETEERDRVEAQRAAKVVVDAIRRDGAYWPGPDASWHR